MKIDVFGKTVELNDDLVNAYKNTSLHPFVNAQECAYLAIAGGQRRDAIGSAQEIKEAIEKSMRSALAMEEDIPEVVERIATGEID